MASWRVGQTTLRSSKRDSERNSRVSRLAGQHEHADTANQTDHNRQRTQLTRPRTQLGGATRIGGEPEPDEQTGQHQQRCGDVLDDIPAIGGVVLECSILLFIRLCLL